MFISLHEGFAIVIMNQLNVNKHAHSALQITISLANKPLKCNSQNNLFEGRALLIPPLVNHCFHETDGKALVILVDNEAVISESIESSQIKVLESPEFDQLMNPDLTAEEIQAIAHSLSILQSFSKIEFDQRIKNLLLKIKSEDDYLPSAQNAANLCHLSEDRFMHLFKEELGLPFRKYLQWTKLKRALKSFKEGRTLTEIAHAGGFSDSSHLSHFFTDSFGLNPSEVLKNSQFIHSK